MSPSTNCHENESGSPESRRRGRTGCSCRVPRRGIRLGCRGPRRRSRAPWPRARRAPIRDTTRSRGRRRDSGWRGLRHGCARSRYRPWPKCREVSPRGPRLEPYRQRRVRRGGNVPWRAPHRPTRPSGSIGTSTANGLNQAVAIATTTLTAKAPSRCFCTGAGADPWRKKRLATAISSRAPTARSRAPARRATPAATRGRAPGRRRPRSDRTCR